VLLAVSFPVVAVGLVLRDPVVTVAGCTLSLAGLRGVLLDGEEP